LTLQVAVCLCLSTPNEPQANVSQSPNTTKAAGYLYLRNNRWAAGCDGIAGLVREVLLLLDGEPKSCVAASPVWRPLLALT
jgi:hypothetical protein